MDRTPRHDAEAGQAMVEFALGALALFGVLFALMWMGYTFGKQLDLNGATRTAARRAAVRYGDPNAATYASQQFRDQLTLTSGANASITITPSPPWDHGDTITVRSSTAHSINILGLHAWSGTLRAESKIRVE